jgi:hypothetical protein
VLTVCCPPLGVAATINVNTTNKGGTNGQRSLQEAIYASEVKSNMASTNPVTGTLYAFEHFWDYRGAQRRL